MVQILTDSLLTNLVNVQQFIEVKVSSTGLVALSDLK